MIFLQVSGDYQYYLNILRQESQIYRLFSLLGRWCEWFSCLGLPEARAERDLSFGIPHCSPHHLVWFHFPYLFPISTVGIITHTVPQTRKLASFLHEPNLPASNQACPFSLRHPWEYQLLWHCPGSGFLFVFYPPIKYKFKGQLRKQRNCF